MDGALRCGRSGRHEQQQQGGNIQHGNDSHTSLSRTSTHTAGTVSRNNNNFNNRHRLSGQRRQRRRDQNDPYSTNTASRNNGPLNNIDRRRPESINVEEGCTDVDQDRGCPDSGDIPLASKGQESTLSTKTYSSCSSAVASANSAQRQSQLRVVKEMMAAARPADEGPCNAGDSAGATIPAGAQKSVNGWVLFATGVHPESQEEDLRDAFEEYGAVNSIVLPTDRQTSLVKGYALVEYSAYTEAQDAINELHGKELLGQIIKVDWAYAKPR
jgi:RNA-binding protein 8A